MLCAFLSCEPSRVQGRVSLRDAHLPPIFPSIYLLPKYSKKYPIAVCLVACQCVRITFRGHHFVGHLLALKFSRSLRASSANVGDQSLCTYDQGEKKNHPRTKEFAFIHSTELVLKSTYERESVTVSKNKKTQEMPLHTAVDQEVRFIYLGRCLFQYLTLKRSLLRLINTSYSLV